MTQLQFIALLCAYAVTVVLSMAARKFAVMPPEISKAKGESEEIFKRNVKTYPLTVLFVNVLVLGLGAVGFIGMFFLWPLAPYLFAVAVFYRVFLSPFTVLPWQIANQWQDMLNSIGCILDGAILVLVFFGPARHLFF